MPPTIQTLVKFGNFVELYLRSLNMYVSLSNLVMVSTDFPYKKFKKTVKRSIMQTLSFFYRNDLAPIDCN